MIEGVTYNFQQSLALVPADNLASQVLEVTKHFADFPTLIFL